MQEPKDPADRRIVVYRKDDAGPSRTSELIIFESYWPEYEAKGYAKDEVKTKRYEDRVLKEKTRQESIALQAAQALAASQTTK